jgi:hypothetical protein
MDREAPQADLNIAALADERGDSDILIIDDDKINQILSPGKIN